MLLGVLQGYNIGTGEYTVGGVPTERPKDPFCVAESALPTDYDDISSNPEYWDAYGVFFLGQLFGFRDWMSLRAIIYPLITAICGTDYSNWNALSADQKATALEYFPTKIIAVKGFTFFATEAGGQANAVALIDNYLAQSSIAREKRYVAYISFGYQYLGGLQGIKAESYLREDFLDVTYIKRGVLYIADDGIEGLGNWTIADNGYATTGLKARIDSGEFVLGGGISTAAFIGVLENILNNGSY